MSLTGKGLTIWKVQSCEYGNTQAIVRKAQAAGLTHVLVKVADGAQPYNASYLPGLIGGLKTAGIAVWGWQYIYGNAPIDEANAAISATNQLQLDGLVVNAEKEYEGKFGQAGAYMEHIAAGLKHTPLALTSFRAPEYHPSFPWAEFLSHCVLNMPQVFWSGGHDPAQQLKQTLQQFKHIYPVVPVIPTGAAYEDTGWRPSQAEIREFMSAAKQLGLDGVNFWNWDYAGSPQGNDLWQAISAFDWLGLGKVEDDPVSALFQALNRSDVETIVKLYEPEGVLVTNRHTLKGPYELRNYYTNLLDAVLPKGQFAVEKRESRDNIEHVTWSGSTSSLARKISGGQDTIGLRDGRIQYHTSLYQVS
jgi:hypothetical protein